MKQLTHAQAIEKRDSLARCIYSALFNWLVDKINYSITAVDSVWGTSTSVPRPCLPRPELTVLCVLFSNGSIHRCVGHLRL